MLELNREVAQQGMFQIPPVAVLTGSLAGVQIDDVILYATLLYIVVQLIVIYPKFRGAIRDIKNKTWKRNNECNKE